MPATVLNLARLLTRAAARDGARAAVFLDAAPVHDYAGLARRAAALAGALRGTFGLAAGERVALFMRNHPAVVEILFACWHAGLVAVPVNAKLHAKELAFVLAHSDTRLCFATPDTVEDAAKAVTEAGTGARVVDVTSRDYAALFSREPLPMAETAADDVAWLFYTSGTTGRPKGAMLTHRNLMTMTLAYFADVDAIAREDAVLHAAPMSHGSGLYILPHVAAGAAQVVPSAERFEPGAILDLVQHHPGTTIFAAPTMVKRLVEHPGTAGADLTNLKTVVYGGGPMYLADIRKALAVMGNRFVQIYGQGDSPMTITALARRHHADTAHPRYLERLASVGMAYSAVEVRVADTEGRALPAGETGEVLVRGDTVMRGYWNDGAASAAALKGGWLHTGDVGAFDADGFLTLKDRSKDLIISGGSNIYPREVEEVLLTHPAVAEASIVGRPHPEWGEEVVAFVVPAAGASLEPAALEAHCGSRIARYKRPRAYIAVEALPKNNYGKVLKTELRKRLADEKGAP